jgi:uncharacterized protein YbjT (DUF2867 family)
MGRTSNRILVTGATGQIGSEVVAQLRACGDLSAPETLESALEDVGAIFLVWVAPPVFAARAIECIASRVERVVFLSAPIRTNHPFFQQPNAVRAVNAAIERLIQKSTLQWTMVRPAPFALNCRNWWAPQIAKGDVVRWFHGAAATAPVHERDIAAVAVGALSADRHAGLEYVLTGPESLTQREQLAIIGDTIGRRLVFEEVAPGIAKGDVLGGWPAPIADMILSAFGAALDRPALVTSAIEEVTGGQARTFREWAMDHATDFSRV